MITIPDTDFTSDIDLYSIFMVLTKQEMLEIVEKLGRVPSYKEIRMTNMLNSFLEEN